MELILSMAETEQMKVNFAGKTGTAANCSLDITASAGPMRKGKRRAVTSV
ncbi:MAG: hypothetical protein ONB50_06940 [candidate division KSB1 bacterium]|nr:hypothetical protein [candidate division KSB1 bacterium]MDZ7352375.1 hypothetical protein [candidate division KSB1 bacterium]